MVQSVNTYALYVVLNCILLILSLNAHAKINYVNLDRITVEDGLSQASIYSIMQDDQGFMWFGNESGINIYDGYNFRSLPGPNNEFASLSVNSIRQDSHGKIWLAFWDTGLYGYDPKTNTYDFVAATDPENDKYAIIDTVEDKANDSLWFYTTKSIIQYNLSTKTFSTRIDLSSQLDVKNGTIYRIKLHNNNMYIGTRRGIFVYSIAQHKLVKLPEIDVSLFSQHELDQVQINRTFDFSFNENEAYVGTNDGVFSFKIDHVSRFLLGNIQQFSYQLLAPHIPVWQFANTEEYLYIAASNGLFEYQFDSAAFRHLFEFSDFDKTIANAEVMTLEIDRGGLLWMGSSASGVFVWNPDTELVMNYQYVKGSDNSLSASSVNSVYLSDNNPKQLWVSTGNGLNAINLRNNTVEQFLKNHGTTGLNGDSNIQNVAADSMQRLWLATDDGIRLFDLNTKTIVAPQYGESTNQWLAEFFGLTLLHKDVFWAMGEKGLHRLDVHTGERQFFDRLPKDFDPYTVGNMMVTPSDNTNEIYISTHDTLWLFNVNTQIFERIYRHPGIISTAYTYFSSWQIDKKGTMWLSLAGIGLIGLSTEDYQPLHFFNYQNSGIDINVYGLQLDNQGNLWLSSHAGIYFLDLDTMHFRRFGRGDGFINTEFNTDAFLSLPDGRFVYGGIAGLSIFEPVKLSKTNKSDAHEVKIVGVSALSRELNTPLFFEENAVIDLAFDDIGIRIDFSTLTYGSKNKPLYEYGFVNGVQYPASSQNYVNFPMLDSGKHVFEVRVKSPITGEYSEAKRITFNVSYAPWRSPAAMTIYGLSIVLLIVYWQRVRYLRQRELIEAHKQVTYRENRLQLALSGSNSEVWDWKARNNEIFGKRLVEDLGYQAEELTYSFEEHVNFIHPEDRSDFLSKWRAFLGSGNKDISFECSYRLRSAEGDWLWYKDLGKVVAYNANNSATRVTGSYTNITESKANIERAQYYGAVFEQTKDWVLIVDRDFSTVRANKSMAQVFGWSQEEMEYSADLLGLSDERRDFYRGIFPEIYRKGHWRGEDLLVTPRGEQYHVIVNISLSRSDYLERVHFICVFTDITAQKTAEKELRYMANYDHLTGLPNRSLLLERIAHAIEHSARQGHSIALCFIDLDRFKQVNDSLGHDYGDMLLKEVTTKLDNVLRVDDTLARIGGDEFVVLLESHRNSVEVGHVAQKIIELVSEPITLDSNVVSIGASIGISLFPEDSKNSAELLRNADVAMYHAKQKGRNNFQFFTEHMNQEATLRLSRESNLKLAVAKDQFYNLYQPIVDAHTGKAVGTELLMRWEHEGEVISPVTFITLAEELGLIVQMTEVAMEKGFEELTKWRELRPQFYLSVNFSAVHFSYPELVDSVGRILNQFDLPANALKIEVTESAFISDPERAVKVMNELKSLGVKLSLDDFGTGYSSLSYLKRLPLDIIKIDRSFVSGIGIEKTDEAIVDATLVLAKSLDMYCVAEGVETKAQLQYLVDRQCHYIQGYFYSTPLMPHEVYRKLKDNVAEIKCRSNLSEFAIEKLVRT